MEFEFFLYDPLLGFMKTPFWLIGESCEKSPMTNKETPSNGDEFCMIAFKLLTLDLNVQKFLFLSLIFNLLSKLLSTRICFSIYEEFHHLALYTRQISILTQQGDEIQNTM